MGKSRLRRFFGHQLRFRRLRAPGKKRGFCRLRSATTGASQVRQPARLAATSMLVSCK
jgi:hypothetical protein